MILYHSFPNEQSLSCISLSPQTNGFQDSHYARIEVSPQHFRSVQGVNLVKVDYLCRCDIEIADVVFPMVVIVGPTQPTLLGLDLAVAAGMVVNLQEKTDSPETSTFSAHHTDIKFLDYERILRERNLPFKSA